MKASAQRAATTANLGANLQVAFPFDRISPLPAVLEHSAVRVSIGSRASSAQLDAARENPLDKCQIGSIIGAEGTLVFSQFASPRRSAGGSDVQFDLIDGNLQRAHLVALFVVHAESQKEIALHGNGDFLFHL